MQRFRLALLPALALALLVAPAAASAAVGPGAHGRKVAGIQVYLARIGYLPWNAVNGSYDYRTEQAVMAFQGWRGLTRDGVAGTRTLKLLKKARRPRPWSQYHGRRVEVHIDRQVLLMVDKRNRVVRAIHVSTGANDRTPRGDFTVFRKETMSWSILFSVWMPWASYFTGGYAMHEYPDVPGYPASHGCVRMPAPEAPFEYSFATFGTPVHVH
jgi:lipoprotein-anchoring transpeptidase ErfK/SrfK